MTRKNNFLNRLNKFSKDNEHLDDNMFCIEN